MKSDSRFCQTNGILQTIESSISTIVFMIKPTGVIGIHNFLNSLFLQHLQEGVKMVLFLQPSLLVCIQDDIL